MLFTMARSSGLLRQVAARVLPAATLTLLLIWVTVGYVSEHVFQAEIDAKLKQQAQSQAMFAKTRLENLVTTIRDIAGNDLIVNSLVDFNADTNYLKPFLRSIAIEGFSDIPIILTDYRGRPIAGRDLAAWHQPHLVKWNDQVSQGQSLMALNDDGLVVGVPVYIGTLVEGMLLVRFSPEQLRHALSPIGAEGRIDLISAKSEVTEVGGQDSSERISVLAQVELVLPDSNGLKLLSTIQATESGSQSSYFQSFMLVAFILDLIALIFGIFAAVYLVIKPLNRFIDHLNRSRQEEHVDFFDVDNDPSEIRQLADSFNRFVALEKDLLRERSEQAEKLSVALERERELNGLQRQFVSMVCHEFRTPLAIIDGKAHRILRRHETMAPERLLEAIGSIRLSVSRLTELMESVLNAARLEAGNIEFAPHPCDPGEMIREVVANYREVNPRHRIIDDLELLPSQFVMDIKLVRQVISNLLSNATKYSSEGSNVWIDASSSPSGGLTICVRDEGIGIPKAELDRLFERFFRASTSTGIAGTGIGLHMVKALVDLHHGTIDIDSEEGKGTTISVCLPCRRYQNIDREADSPIAA